ncbi:MAG: helix-turn-helix domain-containing protein [Kutzneria sp.]|nr:helix-turn-helix domain-containing protein [Kutzneria sp.]
MRTRNRRWESGSAIPHVPSQVDNGRDHGRSGRSPVSEQRGPILLKRRLGRRLRELREEARLTLAEAAARLEFSPSKLSRMEKGLQLVTVHELRSMMDLYDGFDPDLLDLARKAREKGWWRVYGLDDKGYVAIEADACTVRDVQLVYIPGLLQTEDYARAIFAGSWQRRSEDVIDKWVSVRMIRQRRLVDPAGGLELAAIVDEASLRKPIGGREVMSAQLEHMVELAGLPNITVQVLPTRIGLHSGMAGAFTVLSFPDDEDPDLVYLDYPGGSVHIEKDVEVSACRLVFDNLRSKALTPGESASLVERVAREL